MDVLGSCVDIGVYTGLAMSFVYQYWGARWTALLSGILCAGGYAMLALLLDHQLPIGVYGVFFFAVGQGNFGLFAVCLASVSKNEPPRNRGKVTGLLQGTCISCQPIHSVDCFIQLSLIWSTIYMQLHTARVH